MNVMSQTEPPKFQPVFKYPDFSIIPCSSGILHLEFENQKSMSLTFARIEEYFESPFPSIRGKYFSWSQFLDAYSNNSGEITYFSEWEGFNIPEREMQEFIHLFLPRKDVSEREGNLITCIWNCGFEVKYLIATKKGGDPTIYLHELSHFYYQSDFKYKTEVTSILVQIPRTIMMKMREDLLKAGYSIPVISDEIHAYLRTSTRAELEKMFSSVEFEDYSPYVDLLKAIPDPI